jgi:hypothetical protein
MDAQVVKSALILVLTKLVDSLSTLLIFPHARTDRHPGTRGCRSARDGRLSSAGLCDVFFA